MYDFNMNEMLSAYNNDPEELMNAFNDALNQTLEENQSNPEDMVRVAASDVAGLWNDYIHFYVHQKGLIDSVNPDNFMIAPDYVLMLTDMVIAAYPFLERFLNTNSNCEEDS